jgi:hypothetical protein
MRILKHTYYPLGRQNPKLNMFDHERQ